MGVMRVSPSLVEFTPLDAASTRMVRNLSILNGTPPRPMRKPRYHGDLPSSRHTRRAITIITGVSAIKAISAMV